VRSIYADWERGDFSSADWAHPEIEFVIVGGPAPGNWNRVTELARVWRDYLSAGSSTGPAPKAVGLAK